ncbi:MAG: helix-turn-helix transcriptional regulator [Flavisolibacter sp.]
MGAERGIVISAFERQQLEQLHAYIPQHLGEDLSVQSLAAEWGLSAYKLRRGFRMVLGVGIRRYTRDCRISRAKQLLRETNEPMKMIASRCGFQNDKVFSRLFKLRVGVSPKAFRIATS